MTQFAAYPGYTSVDYLLQTLAEAPLKQRSHALMDIREGSRLLDAGCGPGIDTVALGSRVGPTGLVVGVDHDPGMVAAAEARALRRGVEGRVAHQQADLRALPFAADTFDASRCERVLQHLDEPRAVLSELRRVTRPGGRIVVIDTDWSAFSIDAPDVELEERIRQFALRHVLRNGWAGRQLFRFMRQLDLLEVAVEAYSQPITSLATARQFAQLDKLEHVALAAGALTAAELERWHTWMRDADRDGVFYCTTTQILVSGRVR